jgi:hypothetical protein
MGITASVAAFFATDIGVAVGVGTVGVTIGAIALPLAASFAVSALSGLLGEAGGYNLHTEDGAAH